MARKSSYIVDQGSLGAVAVVLFGLGQFALCLRMAISGLTGTYSFSEDFLSDLGRTTNVTASYFNNSIMLLGACLVVFFGHSARNEVRRVFGVSGIVSGIGLIGIGLTPLDKYFYEHHIFLVLWLLPMFVMVASSIPIFDGSSRVVVIATSVFLFFGLALYVSSAGTHSAPFHQKVVVILGTAWLLVVCYHSTVAAVTVFVAGISIGKDAATQNFIKQLEAGGLYSSNGPRTGSPFVERDHR